MSTIEFVVRDLAGDITRGMVSGLDGTSAIELGAGQQISLNLPRGAILSYVREGGALVITLVDGRTLVLDGYFGEGPAGNGELYLSTGGELATVELVPGEGNLMYAQYVDGDQFGKWAPDDALYFVREAAVQPLPVEEVASEAGMLLSPMVGGLAGIAPGVGLVGAGLGAATLAAGAAGVAAIGAGGGVAPDPLVVNITSGTKSAGHVVDGADYADGITISGTGTPGVTGVITVKDVSQGVTVDGVGNWSVTFTPDQLPSGEYNEDVTITLTRGDETVTKTDVLVVDTVAQVSVETGVVETDGVVNSDESDDGITLTGTTQPGSDVVVTVDGADYEAAVDNGDWSVDIPATAVPDGEYDLDVTVTATDEHGNSAVTNGTVPIDTVTNVTVDVGGGTVNEAGHGSGVVISGVAEADATVVVTLGDHSQTTTADGAGNWTVTFPASQVPTGELDVPVTAVSTDAAGNTATASGMVTIDTVVDVAVATAAVGGDGVVNAVEQAGPLTLTGTSDAGASLVVTLGGIVSNVVAGADGSWSVDYAAGQFPTGELTVPVTVVATDVAGNVATTSGTIAIDTVMNVNVATGIVGGDGMVNAVEHAAGVTLTGTSQAGASVQVTAAGATRTTTADANGNWSLDYAAGQLPTGEVTVPVSVRATDAAGNVATATGSFAVDTVMDVSLAAGSYGGDMVVNAVEHAGGITLSGTSQAGATVSVGFAGSTRVVTADGAGNWSLDYASGSVATGEATLPVTVSASDAAGNTASASGSVRIDTLVNKLDNTTGLMEGDDVVNNAEARDGITLTGAVETGSTVIVTFEGQSRAATVDGAGNWSVNFGASEIRAGEYQSTVTITATDAAGNTSTISDTFHVDTVAPEAADVESVTTADNVTRGFSMVNVASGTSVDVTEYVNNSDAAATDVAGGSFVNPLNGELQHVFNAGGEVPDGSHLLVTNADAAGNTNTTLLVLDEDGNSVVNMGSGALNAPNIGAIDLEFAEDSALTLSTADLEALSGNDNNLIIHGGIDDHVALTGAATKTGVKTLRGQDYDVYAVGTNGAELTINQDIDFQQTVI